MTVVVTGASGHVGANLVRALVARGDAVRVVVRSRTAAVEGLDVERVAGDVCDPDSLRSAFAGAEVVYHLAGVISIDGDRGGRVRAVNVGGARNAAEAALHAGVRRFVHCSSVHAYDLYRSGQPGQVDETWPRVPDRAPYFAYDRSKAAGEAAVREIMARGLDAVILNPSGVIGPYDFEPSRTGRMLLSLRRRTLPALVAGGFDFVDARDVATALVAAGDHGTAGENYLVTGAYATVVELAATAEAVTGVRRPRLVTPVWAASLGAPLATVAARTRRAEALYTRESLTVLRSRHRFDHAKATRDLGHAPRPLADTIRDAYAWFGRLAPH